MRSRNLILFCFIVLKFILQYTLIDPVYELHRDEFLHLDQAHHLAWGFTSVPPLTSWLSWIILKLGNSVFWIKFFPALFGALTIVLVWKTVFELKGSLFAMSLAAASVLVSALLRLNTLYQPNSFDVLAWTAIMFGLIRYINSGKAGWLYFCGLAFGIGFLNKYNILFLATGLFAGLMLVKERAIIAKREMFVTAGIVLLLILPNLVWQFRNEFPVLSHMRELAETQLVNVNRLDFLKSQMMFYFAGFYLILIGLAGLWIYPAFRPYRFLFWNLTVVILVFILFRAKDYYAIGLFPIYIALGAVYLDHISVRGLAKKARYLLFLLPVLVFYKMNEMAFPNRAPGYIIAHNEIYKQRGMLRWEDGKDHLLPQDFADMLGWKELAFKVDSVRNTLAQTENVLILCDNYGQAGAINYYGLRKDPAVSFSADYINWIDTGKVYQHLIRVKNFSSAGDELAETLPYFETGSLAAEIKNPYSRESGTKIFVFKSARIDIRARIKAEIRALKEGSKKF